MTINDLNKNGVFDIKVIHSKERFKDKFQLKKRFKVQSMIHNWALNGLRITEDYGLRFKKEQILINYIWNCYKNTRSWH